MVKKQWDYTNTATLYGTEVQHALAEYFGSYGIDVPTEDNGEGKLFVVSSWGKKTVFHPGDRENPGEPQTNEKGYFALLLDKGKLSFFDGDYCDRHDTHKWGVEVGYVDHNGSQCLQIEHLEHIAAQNERTPMTSAGLERKYKDPQPG